MVHRAKHPVPVEGCMGCKVLTIGYDGRTLSSTRTDENGAILTSHRDGREDVTVRVPSVAVTTAVQEIR